MASRAAAADVAARSRQAVPALVRLDRGLRVELVARGDTEPLIRVRSLRLPERLGEQRARLRPRAARQRATTPSDCRIDLFRPHALQRNPESDSFCHGVKHRRQERFHLKGRVSADAAGATTSDEGRVSG